MRIASNTGEISFEERGVVLGAGLSKVDFLESDFGKDTKIKTLANGYTYSFFNIDGYNVQIFFSGERLDSINLSLIPEAPDEVWYNYEMQETLRWRYRRLLSEMLGQELKNYRWGSAEACFDFKDGVSLILIRYSR